MMSTKERKKSFQQNDKNLEQKIYIYKTNDERQMKFKKIILYDDDIDDDEDLERMK